MQRWGGHVEDAHSGSTRTTTGGPRMTHPNEQIVRQAYKAFGEGDIDTLRSLIAPDAVWIATVNSPALAGEYKGADDILGYLGKFVELSDGTFTAELQSVRVEGDDTVVATHRDKAQRGGKTLDHDETLTITMSDGKLSRVVEHHPDEATYIDFWS